MRRSVSCILLVAILPGAAWAEDACETVKAAYDKLGTVAAYRQTIDLGDGAPMKIIVTEDAVFYDEGGGAWTKIPLDAGTRAQMLGRTIPSAASLIDCRAAGSDTIDGAAMSVVEYTPPPIGDMAQDPQKVWIGDADGLPHRMTMENDGESLEVTLSFAGVKAPE